MPAIFENDFPVAFSPHLQLFEFREKPNWLFVLDSYFYHSGLFAEIGSHFFSKLLLNITIGMPSNFILHAAVVCHSILTWHPDLIPVFWEFCYSFIVVHFLGNWLMTWILNDWYGLLIERVTIVVEMIPLNIGINFWEGERMTLMNFVNRKF